MRLLQFTAGAGAMYCGSCLHSNTLALHLSALGADVTLVPLYTPTRTDEENASVDQVMFGGVSVFLEQAVPFLRKTPKIFDALWDSRIVLDAVGSFSGSTDPANLGPLTVSMLRGEAGHQKKELDRVLAWLKTQPRFDAALLPYTLLLGLAGPLRREGLKVACELQGEDLFLDALKEPWRGDAKRLISERARDVDLFIAGSRYYRDAMSADLGIPIGKIRIVPHGISIDDRLMEAARPAPGVFTIGFFARIAPEKGLHVLADAYATFRRRRPEFPARLRAAGYLGREHRKYLRDVSSRLGAAGLRSEFEYAGAPDRAGKFAFLRGLDLLAAPTPYREPKGLFALEAMACSVPVLLPAHGALPELIEATGGGVLHPPGDVGEIVDALNRLAGDRAERERLGATGARAVREKRGASDMARATLDLLGQLVA